MTQVAIPPLRTNINTASFTARREYGRIPGRRHDTFEGDWVVRDQSGTYRDYSQFRSDLHDRFDNLEVIEE